MLDGGSARWMECDRSWHVHRWMSAVYFIFFIFFFHSKLLLPPSSTQIRSCRYLQSLRKYLNHIITCFNNIFEFTPIYEWKTLPCIFRWLTLHKRVECISLQLLGWCVYGMWWCGIADLNEDRYRYTCMFQFNTSNIIHCTFTSALQANIYYTEFYIIYMHESKPQL